MSASLSAAKASTPFLPIPFLNFRVMFESSVGHGVAVPHVKTPDVDSLKIAIGISESGIDFKAFDKQPVHSIFLLVSPEERPEEHIDAMEAIFTCLGRDQFRRFLRQAESAQDVLTLIDEADAVQAG